VDDRDRPSTRRARWLAVCGALGISLAAIFFRQSGASPATGTLFRAVYAWPLLAWLARRQALPLSTRALAVGGGVLFGADLLCWHAAIDRIGAGLATVMANTQVVWVGLGAWVIAGERTPPRALAVLPLLVGGVVLLAGVGDRDAFGRAPLVGTLLGLAGALTYAAYLLIHRRACRGSSWPLAQLRDVTLGVGLIAAAAGLGAVDPQFSLSPQWPMHGWLLALALVVQVGSWLAVSASLPHLPALETSTLLLLQPVGTLLWSTLLLRETPSWRQGLGALWVLVALAIVQLRPSKQDGRRT
jgi:drug/metabolite transporter (DMT)-like permease